MSALFTIPTFFQTAAGAYWHRPRSVSQQTWGWSVRAWCGGSGKDDARWSDVPDGPVCGTCDGRSAGASTDRGDLIFTPRGTRRPTHCPGGARLDDAFEKVGSRVGRCLVCGALEPIRAKGGPYDPRVALGAHAPGEGIETTRCDEHGWSDLVLRGGRVECRCGPMEGEAI